MNVPTVKGKWPLVFFKKKKKKTTRNETEMRPNAVNQRLNVRQTFLWLKLTV